MIRTRLLALSLLYVIFSSIGFSDIGLVQARSHFSTVDERRAKSGERVWEITVHGKRSGSTLINLDGSSEKPKIESQFRNGKGDLFFTIEQNFSDIGWTPWWLTFLYSKGKLRLLTREWAAAGLADDGGMLFRMQKQPQMDPSSSPYENVQVMKIEAHGRTHLLGVVETASLGRDGTVSGYFYEDESGKRGNGNKESDVVWYKRRFKWTGVEMRLLNRTRVPG